MTKLLYIHNIAMPGPEANTVNVAKMCDAFAGAGCTVTLATLPGVAPALLQDAIRAHYGLRETIDVVALPRACARPAIAGAAGAWLARQRRDDIVYTRAPHVAYATCRAGLPTILELHTDLDAFSTIGRYAFHGAARHPRLRSVVVISEALAAHVRPLLGKRGDIVTVAPDGADIDEGPTSVRRGERFAAGFVGRFYKGKGVELIAAIAPLCPWADFHVVGGDAEVARALVGVRLPANMTCHGDVPHAAVGAMIRAWDVVLAPYQRSVIVADGRTDAARWMSPLKIFEYMAAGKAILASNLPVLREILTDGENALLLPPDEPKVWARAITTLRDDDALRDALGTRARAALVTRHTWAQRARTILKNAATGPSQAQQGAPQSASTRSP